MNIIWAVIEILLLASICLTAIQEPKLSFEYGKAVVTSVIKVINWCIKFIINIINTVNQDDQIPQNSTSVLP